MEYNINSISPSSCIPEGCTNLYNFGIYTNRGIMDSFNEMRFMVLESEISILNEYSQDLLITESMKDKMKEIGKRIKEGFLKMLKNIKEFFAKIATFIKNLFTKVKQQVFTKATKTDFDNAVEFFKNYNGEQVKFTIESEDDNIFFGTKDFIKQTDEYNKEILGRAQNAFNNLNALYSQADMDTSSGYWIGKMIEDKKNATNELKNSQSSQVYGYILYNKEYENGISDKFGKKEIEAAIYSNLSEVSFLRNPITSSNLKNFSKRISDAVYGSEIQNKWVGITKDEYDKLKGMIEEAIKYTGKFKEYVDWDKNKIDKQNKRSAMQQRDDGSSEDEIYDYYGPKYALYYTARCKEIISVLVSVSSVMNNMINDIYHKDIKLVCSIINKYYKLSKQKKEVSYKGDFEEFQYDKFEPNPA